MHKLLQRVNTFSRRPHHLTFAARIYILRVMHIKNVFVISCRILHFSHQVDVLVQSDLL